MLTTAVTADGFALAIHGGAGVLAPADLTPEREAACRVGLRAALQAGAEILRAGGPSLAAVVAAVQSLEDCPWFNAGRGAALNHDGKVELDAAVMDGATRRAGAIAAVHQIRNPVAAARMVLEHSPHVLLVGDGAEQFAEAHQLPLVSPEYFLTEERRARWAEYRRTLESDNAATPARSAPSVAFADHGGTVGAVARDRHGQLAAATSTGGTANKQPGRVGDSPLIGAGTYACDATCAVSATGQGEFFIRGVTAYDLAALIEYRGLPLIEAADIVIHQKLTALGGEGGLIAVDCVGRVAMPFNSAGMYRGYLRDDGREFVAIQRESGGQETGDRRQETGDRRQESGVRSQESEVRSQKLKVSDSKQGVRN